MEEIIKVRARTGRKPLRPEQRRSQYWVYLTPVVHEKILKIGGSKDFTEALCNIAAREAEVTVDLVEMATQAA